MDLESLVMKYFNSWQSPTDFEEMADCLTPTMTIDAGIFHFDNREAFVNFCTQNPTPWKEVTLLSSIYSDGKAAIMYEGVNTANNQRMRVSEHLEITDGKISDIKTVITALGN